MADLVDEVFYANVRKQDVAPAKNPAFSPNLYRWLSSKGRFHWGGGVIDAVYRVKPGTRSAIAHGEGTLIIGCAFNGYPDDTDFSGIELMHALSAGAKAGRVCFLRMAPDLELVPDFWDRYLKVGRCAIDPEHQTHFSGGDRFSHENDVRACLWCGVQHQRVLTPRVVMDESWIPTGVSNV